MKNIIISLLFLLMMIPVFGQTSPLIRAGNDYYKKGDYQKAIVSYEGVLHNGYESAELYFNLGNAYYKTGKIAPAVLNYERAKRLNPTDDEIKFNLELARNHTVDKIILVPDFFLKRWYNALSETLSSNAWAYFCIISFFFFLVTFVLYLFAWKAGIKKLSFWISLLLFVMSV
ncbi:MAG: tetratricopeptide repeat protein, partial [Bacteroidota bacterium]|nr:tetratricopeptide repeat protein [Bacteroidota bacterium]